MYGLTGDDGRTPLQAGDTVAGKYTLLEEIPRRGGAGRTFKAEQTALKRVVELRVLPENSITKPADHARFRREVATWGRLRSDHLVRLYDSGFTEDNAPYMALEFVDDGSVGAHLRAEGPLPLDMCRVIAEQVLDALGTAHEAQVLHRDVTPDALLLGTRVDGSLHCRLTGFGLAKHMGDEDDDPTAITMTGQIIGKPAYMAPETIMLGTLDPRTDLYSAGVTLYEIAAGRRPFPGTSLSELLKAHIEGIPDALIDHRPDIDPIYAALVDGLLAKDPLVRFQTADQALGALRSGVVPQDRKTFAPPTMNMMPVAKRPAWIPPLIGFSAALVLAAVIVWFVMT